METRIPVQDIVHDGTKLRTRFFKRNKFVIGGKIAAPADLQTLMTTVSKKIHFLNLDITVWQLSVI